MSNLAIDEINKHFKKQVAEELRKIKVVEDVEEEARFIRVQGGGYFTTDRVLIDSWDEHVSGGDF